MYWRLGLAWRAVQQRLTRPYHPAVRWEATPHPLSLKLLSSNSCHEFSQPSAVGALHAMNLSGGAICPLHAKTTIAPLNPNNKWNSVHLNGGDGATLGDTIKASVRWFLEESQETVLNDLGAERAKNIANLTAMCKHGLATNRLTSWTILLRHRPLSLHLIARACMRAF